MSSLICAWTNGWANNRGAGDLRCHGVHYDATALECNGCWRVTDRQWPWYCLDVVNVSPSSVFINSFLYVSLTHWGRDKMAAISQTTFSSAFSWMKIYKFRLGFHWSLFLRVQLTIFQNWFRQWLGAVQATSHYLNQWWLVYWRIYASLGLIQLI